MTATKPERPIVRITDDTTRADLIECIGNLNKPAAAITRRGRAFQLFDPEYAKHHARINAILTELDNRADG